MAVYSYSGLYSLCYILYSVVPVCTIYDMNDEKNPTKRHVSCDQSMRNVKTISLPVRVTIGQQPEHYINRRNTNEIMKIHTCIYIYQKKTVHYREKSTCRPCMTDHLYGTNRKKYVIHSSIWINVYT